MKAIVDYFKLASFYMAKFTFSFFRLSAIFLIKIWSKTSKFSVLPKNLYQD